MEQFSPPKPAAVKPIKKKKQKPFLPIILLVLLYLALVIWMNFPITKHFLGMDPPTATPSVTPTFYPTRTPRPTFTPTVTPTVTPTPLPASANKIFDVNGLNPPINGLNPNSIIMDIKDAVVSPGLDNPIWSPGSKAIPGTILSDSIYITQGSASISWKLDVPLAPGLYKIYVVDTLYGSAGNLDFSVLEGNNSLSPLTDSTRVRFASSQSETDPQSSDQWRSIGIYNVPGNDLLSINSSWQPRDINTLVAIDRVLIEPLPATDMEMLSKLDENKTKIIVDDLDAKIEGNPLLINRDDSLSWNGKFQSITNPEKDVKVTYTMPYAVSPGQYEIKLWMPGAHHSGSFDISIKVNDKEISSGKLPTVKEADLSGGTWVSIGGMWDSSSPIYGSRVKYSITFTIKGGSVGETGLDAVVFLGLPSNDATPTPMGQ